MSDLVFLALVVAFFVLATAFVRGCGWIGRSDNGGEARDP